MRSGHCPCLKAPGVRRHTPYPQPASPFLPEALPVFVLIRHVTDWFRFLFCFLYLVLNIGFEYNCHRSHYLFKKPILYAGLGAGEMGMLYVNVCKWCSRPVAAAGESGGCHGLTGQPTGSPQSCQLRRLLHIYVPVENNPLAVFRRSQNSPSLFPLMRKIMLLIFQVIYAFFYVESRLDVSYMC